MSNEPFFKLNIHYGGILFRNFKTHIRKLNVILYSIRRKCTSVIIITLVYATKLYNMLSIN